MEQTTYTIFEECEHRLEFGKCGQCKEAMKQQFETFAEVGKLAGTTPCYKSEDDEMWGNLIRSIEYNQMSR